VLDKCGMSGSVYSDSREWVVENVWVMTGAKSASCGVKGVT